MSQETADREIGQKRQELEKANFNLGGLQGGVQSGGSGGFFQAFEKARIYWHPNTGAHEVHGNILDQYVQLGGSGANPSTGRRDFGYPKNDELRTPVGVPISHFEFGDIYAVRGAGGVGLYGELLGNVVGSDGLPLLEPQVSAEGEIVYCENNAVFKPKGALSGVIRLGLRTPDLGRPDFILPEAEIDLPISISCGIDAGSWDDLLALVAKSINKEEEIQKLLVRLWAGKLVLQSVRNKVLVSPVSVQAGQLTPSGPNRRFTVNCRLAKGVSLPDRELFTLCFQRPDTKLVPVAPHCLYTRKNWVQFGFIHATDLHVTRRAESFRAQLKAAGRASSAQVLTNPNDSVRALIKFANQLHDRGEIDFILATGDLVDYIFEGNDNPAGGGNFAYLEKLLLGQAPARDEEGVGSQELHVPIFTSLGNHDYVVNHYELFFEVDIEGVENPILRKFTDFNLSGGDAEVLQGGKKLSVSREAAQKMLVSSRTATEYYQKHINSQSTYVIRLGESHRIVMLDTGPNRDVVSGITDAIQEILGSSNEDEKTFVRGTPNTAGNDLDLSVLRTALNEAPAKGIFIIGMHNPPLNTSGNEYPHYFRESERPDYDEKRLGELVNTFLSRQSGLAGPSGHNSWLRKKTKHFKNGSLDDLLDFGIVKWSFTDSTDLLKLMTDKRVDVLLCGHVHQRVEFRVKPDGNGGLLYFIDFYTENPSDYRESFDWSFVPGPGFSSKKSGDLRPIHIQVDPEAKIDEAIREVREQRPDNTVVEYRALRVPPYPDPLNQATNKVDWWLRHRPLILQTACVGFIDYSRRSLRIDENKANRPRVSFQGVRLLTVTGNEISRISYVGMDDIRAGKLPLSVVGSLKDILSGEVSTQPPKLAGTS